MKRLTIASGPFEWKLIRLRDGLIFKINLRNQSSNLHVTFLVSPTGRITLHSSNEDLPTGHSGRNKNIMAFDASKFAKEMDARMSNMKTLFEAEIPRGMNPNLSSAKLWGLPMVPHDFSQVVTMRGKNGHVDVDQLGGMNLIDAVDLPQSSRRRFIVFRKTAQNWSSRGLLFLSPDGGARFFLRNVVIDKYFQMLSDVIPGFSRRYPRMRFTQHEMRSAARLNSRRV